MKHAQADEGGARHRKTAWGRGIRGTVTGQGHASANFSSLEIGYALPGYLYEFSI